MQPHNAEHLNFMVYNTVQPNDYYSYFKLTNVGGLSGVYCTVFLASMFLYRYYSFPWFGLIVVVSLFNV